MLQWYLHLLVRLVPGHLRRRLDQDLRSFWSEQIGERRYSGLYGRLRYLGAVTIDALRLAVRGRTRRVTGAVFSGSTAQRLIPSVRQDVRHGLRLMVRAPLYTLVAVVTLSLGVGATTAVFSVVKSVLLRPLPYPQSERLVSIQRSQPGSTVDAVAWPDFRDWRQDAEGFAGMIAYTETGATLQLDGSAQMLSGISLTAEVFDMLGTPLLHGRTFSEEEVTFNGAEAVVLSHGLWMDQFGADPDLVGRSIILDGESVPVVGVAPPGFSFPDRRTQYWTALHEDRLLQEAGLPTGRRTLSFLNVVARLGDGVALESARAELVGLAKRIDEAEGTYREGRSVSVVSLQELLVGDVRTTLVFIFGAVALVLLVASANVAGLSLGRATGRAREVGLRLALGASRGRIARQIVTENLVLALVAGGIGVTLATVITRVMEHIAPSSLPRIDEIHVDGGILAFGFCATMLSGLLLGIFPAWQMMKTRGVVGLRGARSGTGGKASMRAQAVLVVGQVALAVVLLSSAVLLVRSYRLLASEDRGFDAENRIVASVNPTFPPDVEPERVDAFYRELLARVSAIPGVRNATSTYSPPFAGNNFRMSVHREDEVFDEDNRNWIESIIVRDNYFATLGIPILAGRDFDDRDRLSAPTVVMVNQTLAEQFWPGETPVGKRFVFTDGISGSVDSFDRRFFPKVYTVVGMVGDTRGEELGRPPEPTSYRPHSQITWATQYLLMAVDPDVPNIGNTLRDVVWSVDPTVPVHTIRNLNSQVLDTVALPRFRAVIFGVFAGLAFLLSTVGVYSVISLSVTRRRREIGIRLALGADGGRVVRQTLLTGGWLTAIGIGIGLAATIGITRLLASILYEVSPTDVTTYAVVVLMITVVSLCACVLPARKAARVDPVRSLQHE